MRILRILCAIAGTTWLLMRHTQRIAMDPEILTRVPQYHWVMLGAIFVGVIWLTAFAQPATEKQRK